MTIDKTRDKNQSHRSSLSIQFEPMHGWPKMNLLRFTVGEPREKSETMLPLVVSYSLDS